MDPLLDMEQAATLLNISKQQLYELCRNRSRMRQRIPIPRIRLGKLTRFRASALNEWLCQLEKLEKDGGR